MQKKPGSLSDERPLTSDHRRSILENDVVARDGENSDGAQEAFVTFETLAVATPARDDRDRANENQTAAGDRLSAEQRHVGHDLRHLFGSLCGGIPGQYWPQALLDSAGKFNRPTFPSPRRPGKQ